MPLSPLEWLTELIPPLRRKRRFLFAFYTAILDKNFPYFHKLSASSKKEFVQRVHHFRKSKNFHFIEMPERDDVSVLVSAAAIQLSFGLPEYLFGFFEDIYIIRGAYTYGDNTTPWAGHVNGKGIHVAWDHVLKGYASDSDGYNVGLHEMAHALEYEFAYGDYRYDHERTIRFGVVRRLIAEYVLEQSYHPGAMFSEQGLTNYHECWAESVEFFFEKPATFHAHYPQVYEGISGLLKQNPLKWQSEELTANQKLTTSQN